MGSICRAVDGEMYMQGRGWWDVPAGPWMVGCICRTVDGGMYLQEWVTGCPSSNLERTLPSPPQAVTPEENCLSFYRLRSGGALRLEKM